MLHGLFHLAVELGVVVESPTKAVKLLKEESPERLTPTWEQAQTIIGAAKRQSSKDVLSAMLLMGRGQAEIANLLGEHIDFARGQITVRRQKTQKVFTIPMYRQVRPLLERLRAEGQIVPGKPLFERARPREALSLACRRLDCPQFSPAASGVLLLFVLWKRGLMQGVWHRGGAPRRNARFTGLRAHYSWSARAGHGATVDGMKTPEIKFFLKKKKKKKKKKKSPPKKKTFLRILVASFAVPKFLGISRSRWE